MRKSHFLFSPLLFRHFFVSFHAMYDQAVSFAFARYSDILLISKLALNMLGFVDAKYLENLEGCLDIDNIQASIMHNFSLAINFLSNTNSYINGVYEEVLKSFRLKM